MDKTKDKTKTKEARTDMVMGGRHRIMVAESMTGPAMRVMPDLLTVEDLHRILVMECRTDRVGKTRPQPYFMIQFFQRY